MSTHIFALMAWLAATVAVGRPVPNVRVTREVALPAGAVAADIRLAGSDVLIAAGRDGVRRARLHKDGSLTWTQELGGEHDLSGFFFTRMIAADGPTVVVASPFNAIGWRRPRASGPTTFAFASAMDVEVVGDRVFILGANRDAKGRWAPEGAIAWTGTLSNDLKDLRPLVLSVDRDSHPPAVGVARCGLLKMGSIRAISQDEVLVVPGVEAGAYIFDRNGRLVRTFGTRGLSFLDRCAISQDQAALFARDMPTRMRWLNQERVLDEIIALQGRPALIVREVTHEGTRWDLITLDATGRVETTIRLPFKSASPHAHIRADVTGTEAVFLIRAYGEKRDRTDEPPSRLVFARIEGR